MNTKKFISIEEAMKNANSTANQRIKLKFVQREVLRNVNTMTEYILSKSFEDQNAPFTWDEVSTFYTYPEYIGKYANFSGGNEEARQAEIDRLQALIDGIESDDITDEQRAIQEDIEKLEELETEPAEVFEWWAVSTWLAEKLEEEGECIINQESIWGRQTTGQAILLDYVISKICAKLEILEGQENSWA
jgi:hypothetical protein